MDERDDGAVRDVRPVPLPPPDDVLLVPVRLDEGRGPLARVLAGRIVPLEAEPRRAPRRGQGAEGPARGSLRERIADLLRTAAARLPKEVHLIDPKGVSRLSIRFRT